MPYYRIRAKVNGVTRRSWGESANEQEARKEASKQLSTITKKFEILTVEEITAVDVLAEQAVGKYLDKTAINIK